eukprot:TRINITY_DN884_c0_g1_i3.p6 TRINITY_DN884_c0_g1~~TRINITY_DN884_c0_g1_i3.p6  ORF type:complete len:113 (-),score=33.27 TRINITY_DN884_c0_g1_i3:12-350(-)
MKKILKQLRLYSVQVNVNFRPYVREFLEEAAKFFEIIVYTASEKDYADRIINILDPTKKLIKYRLFRNACIDFGGVYVKDLHALGRDLAKTCLLYTSPSPRDLSTSRMPSSA